MRNIYRFIVKYLPKQIIYFSVLRACAFATSGKYGKQEVPALTVMECLDRWEKQ